MNVPIDDMVRRRPTTNIHQAAARPQLETTVAVHEFVDTHFAWKVVGDTRDTTSEEDGEWEFFCNCRHPRNCSIFRDDPKVVALLKGEHPRPPQILDDRTVAGAFVFAIFAIVFSTVGIEFFEYYAAPIFQVVAIPRVVNLVFAAAFAAAFAWITKNVKCSVEQNDIR